MHTHTHTHTHTHPTRLFCVSYDMQERSSKIFGDIIDALGGFIQSNFTSAVSPTLQLTFGISASSSSNPLSNLPLTATPSYPSLSPSLSSSSSYAPPIAEGEGEGEGEEEEGWAWLGPAPVICSC